MAPSRPPLSITLPSSFEFHYTDGQLPRTPQDQQDDDQPQSIFGPPPPPKPHFKVKRRRNVIPDFDGTSSDALQETVIPTIEMSEAAPEIPSPMLPTMRSAGLLAPFPNVERLVTPPKTPAPQALPSFASPTESPSNEWSMINDHSGIRPGFERSASVCSSFSDSSVSSCGSSDFSAPNAGSCTSPESEAADPFAEDAAKSSLAVNRSLRGSPSDRAELPNVKRQKIHRNVRWTQAMDDHLWMTYMQYLSDPRVTPFKMLPGTAPPLGVCSRVASKARRTWSHRSATPGSADAVPSSERTQREGSPDTIRPDTQATRHPQWPRSERETRRRLRKLCKRKPSLSAHYQRLVHTRSPSPFRSSSTASHSSEPPQPPFASRDLNLSLVAATAPSMQPEGPLAKLTTDATTPLRPQSQRSSRPADWFGRISRSQAHQKSLSLQSGLSLDGPGAAGSARSLASPFDAVAASSRSHLLQSMAGTKSLGRAELKGKVPSLEAPVELSGAPTMPRSLKRRFKSDEEKPRRSVLQDVFAPDHVQSRPRGFTVGAEAAQETDAGARLCITPDTSSTIDHEMTEAPTEPETPSLGPSGSRSVPRRFADPVPRLGSPFTEPSRQQFNTFPRSYIPTSSAPQPFQQRLQELIAEGSVNNVEL